MISAERWRDFSERGSLLLIHLDGVFFSCASYKLGLFLTSFYNDVSRDLLFLTVIGGFLEGVPATYFIFFFFCPLSFPSAFDLLSSFLLWLFIIRLDGTEELGNLVIPHYTASTIMPWGFL